MARALDVLKVALAVGVLFALAKSAEWMAALAVLWVPVAAWVTLQLTRPKAERKLWPRSLVAWLALSGLSACALTWNRFQILSGFTAFCAAAGGGAALVALGAALWNRRHGAFQPKHAPPSADPYPLGPEPAPPLSATKLAALTALWVWALLPALNALGASSLREVGTIARIDSHRPGVGSRRKYQSNHIGNSVQIKLRDRSIDLDVDAGTLAALQTVNCAEVTIGKGLLGADYCSGSCIVPVPNRFNCADERGAPAVIGSAR